MRPLQRRLALALLGLGLAHAGGATAATADAGLAPFLRAPVAPALPAVLPLQPPARLTLFATEPASGSLLAPDDLSDHRRYVLPVLLSALVPGAGEIATGHFWRGLPLVAIDVATWLANAHYQEEGRNWRDTYQAYADAHWHYDDWQIVLRDYYDGQHGANYDWYDPAADYSCTCPYIPKEEDPQHYYENIGKYLYYYGGWEDWAWSGDPATADSEHQRREYGDMRIESNNSFDRGNQMLYVAMATRLLSVIQVTWLVRGDLQRAPRLEVRPLRSAARTAGLELAYHY